MITIETTDAFKALIEDIKTTTEGYRDPLAFGIARIDLGQLNAEKSLQATYPLINWDENFGSAAIFVRALEEQGVKVDFTQSEVVCNINLEFLRACLAAFTPYSEEAYGDAHKNIQVISALYAQIMNSGSLENEFKVTFIFDDAPLKSVEASYLKLYAISQAKVHLREINLNGAFGALENVAWSDGQPIELDYLREY
ncbi:MAG: tetrahydrodipicolinate N-succinyltransferase N-terminal domain-containing protein, partial [Sulfurimonas sp.]|nr:tetrahydrodipicolinate N-succinyltransferase N-terminal domain-containing protein [Sulfurimonas sp.]